MRGRKPNPTALKLLQGNPGHRPIDTLREPQVVVGLGEAPAYLDAEAKKYWMSQGPELVKLGTLGESDAGLFAIMCQVQSRIVWLSARIEVLRQMKRLAPRDERTLSRYEKERLAAMREYARISSEFGVGAASRTRIKLPHDDGQLDLPGVGEAASSPLGQILSRNWLA